MNWADIITTGILIIVFSGAIVLNHRRKRNGCCSGATGCSCNCDKCKDCK